MQQFSVNLNFLELIIPAGSSGAILIGLLLFSYIYWRWNDKKYLAMICFAACAFLFVFCETLVITSSITGSSAFGRLFHRIEQLGGAFFLVSLPWLLHHVLILTPLLKKINSCIIKIGLFFAAAVTVISFVNPDLFISFINHKETWQKIQSDFGRGQEGILYMVRDIYLGLLIFYSFLIITHDLLYYKKLRYTLPMFIGMAIAIMGAVNDTLHVYYGYHIFLSGINFSRFSSGITLMILFSMFSIIRQFLDQARSVERAWIEVNRSEERFDQIARNINEVFWLIDTAGNKLLYINPAYEKIWGQNPEILYTSPSAWEQAVHPEDRLKVTNAFSSGENCSVEYRIILPDGSIRWIADRLSPVVAGKKNTANLARISIDITDRKQAESDLAFLAYHDQLTGLPNRKSFLEKLGDAVRHSARTGNKNALCFIDLDYFKEANDSFGHQIGDNILQEVSKRIQSVIRNTDYLFRIGGDEFTLILSSISDYTDAALVAQKIIAEVDRPFLIDSFTIYIGASVGISVFPRDGLDANNIICNADTALFEAKKGKNIYRYYDNSMQEESRHKLVLISRIKGALKNNEFLVYYQPLLDADGRIFGAEALLRWNDPQKGLILPGAFIPEAEESGLISQLGEKVLAEACRALKRWHEAGYNRLVISVNISVHQLREPSFVKKISDILAETGLLPEHLHLEITESLIIENFEAILKKINTLTGQGIRFSIDDFGTGYSSLSYLKNLPVHTLKIDRSFILGIPHDEKDLAIIKSIISLAHGLKLMIVAEGVDSEQQIKFLVENGCTGLQGYYYSRPLPEVEFMDFIRNYY